jgi:hypothetical protein
MMMAGLEIGLVSVLCKAAGGEMKNGGNKIIN